MISTEPLLCECGHISLFKRSFSKAAFNLRYQHITAQEFYITDLIAYASKANLPVETISAPFDTIRGINTLQELWAAEHIKRSEIVSMWMNYGVHFTAPIIVDLDVTIGKGTHIDAGVHITKGSRIGEHCHIEAYTHIEQSVLADNVVVKPHSLIKHSTIESNAQIGPFAHIRNQSVIGSESYIGNFVEVSKSTIASHTKIKHLSYIGNATIGSHVNIGAGTIICNYDGFKKHHTHIEDNVLIGSNNSLIAPVTIGKNAITAAGSTITDNVAQDALQLHGTASY